MSQQEDPVMTVKDVAVYLKVAKSKVYRLAQEGELPGRKVGGTWRFLRDEVEEWLRERPLPIDIQPKNL